MDVVGKREQLDLVAHVVCGESAGQEHQAVKSPRLGLDEPVAFRLRRRNSGDTPGVHDVIRQRVIRLQGSDQQIVVLSVRGLDGEHASVHLLKLCSGPHHHHVITSGLEPGSQYGGEPGVIGTDQPRPGSFLPQSRRMDIDGLRQQTLPGRYVQPVATIGVLVNRHVGRRRGMRDQQGLLPVLQSFEGIGRQRHSAASPTGRHVVPRDLGSCQPQLGDALPQEVHVRLVLVLVPDRGHHHRGPAIPPVRMLHRQHAERPAGPDFQEDGIRELPQLVQRVAEPGRPRAVGRPIGRTGRLASRDPGPADVGNEGNRRLTQANLAHLFLERRHDRIEHARVKGVGILHVPANDALGVQRPLELGHCSNRTGHHTQTGAVDQRDG